eukprot:EC691919.1.p1 GENE.EC691919.1~~EC691919.1.p1  ORF type:complete len:217 (+),score=24.76 EC691919.1:46-651(+)
MLTGATASGKGSPLSRCLSSKAVRVALLSVVGIVGFGAMLLLFITLSGSSPPPSTGIRPCEVSLRGREHLDLLESIHLFDPQGLVLDVGANQAGCSVVAAMMGHKVITFEAIKGNANAIGGALLQHGVDPSMVHVIHGAVWHERGATKVFDVQSWMGSNGQMLRDFQIVHSKETEVVETVTVDDHVEQDVLLLKIDVRVAN